MASTEGRTGPVPTLWTGPSARGLDRPSAVHLRRPGQSFSSAVSPWSVRESERRVLRWIGDPVGRRSPVSSRTRPVVLQGGVRSSFSDPTFVLTLYGIETCHRPHCRCRASSGRTAARVRDAVLGARRPGLVPADRAEADRPAPVAPAAGWLAARLTRKHPDEPWLPPRRTGTGRWIASALRRSSWCCAGISSENRQARVPSCGRPCGEEAGSVWTFSSC